MTTVGERLTKCRKLLGFTRLDLANLIGGLSIPTLARWELNTSPIPKLKLSMLVDFFNKNGLLVSQNWIETGIGVLPQITSINSLSTELTFDEIAFDGLNYLKANIKNFSVMQLNSKFFEPLIAYGDYIGGVVSTDLEPLHNQICFCIKQNIILAGFFNFQEFTLTNLNEQSVPVQGADIGKILWIAKRF